MVSTSFVVKSAMRVAVLLATVCLSLAGIAPAVVADERPTVYLTFDDGPSSDMATEQVLNTLRYHGIRATFFVLGSRAARQPEKLSAIVSAGHAIGNHSWSHQLLSSLSNAEIEREFDRTAAIIRQHTGARMGCYRPPFGAKSRRVRAIARARGLTEVLWSIDTHDWRPGNDSETIRAALRRSEDGAIVLLHDGPVGRAPTVQALSNWLAEAVEHYRFDVPPDCENRFDQLITTSLRPDAAEPRVSQTPAALPDLKLSNVTSVDAIFDLQGERRSIESLLSQAFDPGAGVQQRSSLAIQIADAGAYQASFRPLLSHSEDLRLGAVQPGQRVAALTSSWPVDLSGVSGLNGRSPPATYPPAAVLVDSANDAEEPVTVTHIEVDLGGTAGTEIKPAELRSRLVPDKIVMMLAKLRHYRDIDLY